MKLAPRVCSTGAVVPTYEGGQNMTIIDRLLSGVKVNEETGCWEWQKAKYQDGYGRVSIRDKDVRTHRAMWEEVNGPVPEGMCVCHACDVRRCINPFHLWLGTPEDNQHDKARKGRARGGVADRPELRCRRPGELNPNAKLTNESVAEMRRRFSLGESYRSLAKEFGIHHAVAFRAITRVTWKCVS